MATKINEVYVVRKSDVILSVKIGNAQIGSSLVKLDNKEISRGEIKDLIIGNGSDIIGKTLSIKTVITDVSDKTNVLTVQYTLKGGETDKNYDLKDEVSEEGDSVIFRANFEFQG